jgi:hypothetical protein
MALPLGSSGAFSFPRLDAGVPGAYRALRTFIQRSAPQKVALAVKHTGCDGVPAASALGKCGSENAGVLVTSDGSPLPVAHASVRAGIPQSTEIRIGSHLPPGPPPPSGPHFIDNFGHRFSVVDGSYVDQLGYPVEADWTYYYDQTTVAQPYVGDDVPFTAGTIHGPSGDVRIYDVIPGGGPYWGGFPSYCVVSVGGNAGLEPYVVLRGFKGAGMWPDMDYTRLTAIHPPGTSPPATFLDFGYGLEPYYQTTHAIEITDPNTGLRVVVGDEQSIVAFSQPLTQTGYNGSPWNTSICSFHGTSHWQATQDGLSVRLATGLSLIYHRGDQTSGDIIFDFLNDDAVDSIPGIGINGHNAWHLSAEPGDEGIFWLALANNRAILGYPPVPVMYRVKWGGVPGAGGTGFTKLSQLELDYAGHPETGLRFASYVVS